MHDLPAFGLTTGQLIGGVATIYYWRRLLDRLNRINERLERAVVCRELRQYRQGDDAATNRR